MTWSAPPGRAVPRPAHRRAHRLVCAVAGILLLRFGDRGLGIGLLAGWAASALATLAVGAVVTAH